MMEAETVDYRRVWHRQDPDATNDAIAMWKREGVLSADTPPERRAEEMVIAIYAGDEIAGCLTADIQVLPRMREKFAFCRSFIAPAWRGKRLTDRLMIDGHDELCRWSKAHPARNSRDARRSMKTGYSATIRSNLRVSVLSATRRRVGNCAYYGSIITSWGRQAKVKTRSYKCRNRSRPSYAREDGRARRD